MCQVDILNDPTHFYWTDLLYTSLFKFAMLTRLLMLSVVACVVTGSKYVTYRAGTLPLIITAPHGGSKNPSSYPERSIDTG